ncbi:hypothetical protein F5877DRAFT_51570, partial [Lentinula edodes]
GALIVRCRENLDFANTAQLKERLRRLELYGVDKSHPSEDPRRSQPTVLVFHMADMDDCDAMSISRKTLVVHLLFSECPQFQNRGIGIFITHLLAEPSKTFEKAGIAKLLGADAFEDNVADELAKIRPNRW